MYNPAIKVGLSSKFRQPWSGPWVITARKSRLNYALRNQSGKEVIVHVNRMKRALQPQLWNEKLREPRKKYPRRQGQVEEDEPMIPSPGPIPQRAPLVENYPLIPRSPDEGNARNSDTPTQELSPRETPCNHRRDPTYYPTNTPRSRRELEQTRESPPLTRYRRRMQVLHEIPEEGLSE